MDTYGTEILALATAKQLFKALSIYNNLPNSIIVWSKRGGGGRGSGREAQEKEKPVDRGSHHSCETLAGT